jgi:hypothetical protein
MANVLPLPQFFKRFQKLPLSFGKQNFISQKVVYKEKFMGGGLGNFSPTPPFPTTTMGSYKFLHIPTSVVSQLLIRRDVTYHLLVESNKLKKNVNIIL